jgi:hypothetical protein
MASLTAEEVAQAQAALTLLSGFLPAGVQPYLKDIAIDGPVAFSAFTQIKDAIAKVPAGATWTQRAEAFGVPIGTPAHTLCELADLVIKQAATPAPAA